MRNISTVNINSLEETTTSHAGVGRKKVLLKSNQIPHILQFAQVKLKNGEIIKSHKHLDMYEILFIENGQGIIKIDNEIVQLNSGVCVTVEPGEEHELRGIGKEDLIITYFNVDSK